MTNKTIDPVSRILAIREMLATADIDDLYREIANRLGRSWIAPDGRSYGPNTPEFLLRYVVEHENRESEVSGTPCS